MRRAFTRAVSPRLADCELTHLQRVPIDPTKAAAQHAEYERALRDAGFEIVRLPELADDPDAVFVEDTALVLGDHAVITRPGVASRANETDSTAEGLRRHFELHRIETGHLDGGDVLRIGKRLYAGVSTRTDRAGIDALAAIARPLGYEVIAAQTGALPAPQDQRVPGVRQPSRNKASPRATRPLMSPMSDVERGHVGDDLGHRASSARSSASRVATTAEVAERLTDRP